MDSVEELRKENARLHREIAGFIELREAEHKHWRDTEERMQKEHAHALEMARRSAGEAWGRLRRSGMGPPSLGF